MIIKFNLRNTKKPILPSNPYHLPIHLLQKRCYAKLKQRIENELSYIYSFYSFNYHINVLFDKPKIIDYSKK